MSTASNGTLPTSAAYDHAVSVSNGTTALHLALHALGIGPGDEVIVPALSFVASANAVHYTGATPVFADVDPETWTIDPAEIERAITPRTRAIMPVHLYGHPADMAAINDAGRRRTISSSSRMRPRPTVQPSTAGAPAAWAHVGAFSFYANKIITTGEGGMLTTDDGALAARCRLLRDHAMPPETPLLARRGRLQLPHDQPAGGGGRGANGAY